MKALSIGALFLVGFPSFASSQPRSEPEPKPLPHVIRIDGAIAGVGFDFEGLQPTVSSGGRLVSTKGCVKITPSQNSQSLRLLADSINETAPPPVRWTVHRALSGTEGGLVSFSMTGVSAATVPAVDIAAKASAFFELELLAEDLSFDGFAPTSSEERAAARKPKNWLPSNFRIALGDLPADRVTRVEGFTIRPAFEDLDGDGLLDPSVPETIRLVLPVEEAASFAEWFRTLDPAAPEVQPLEIEYQDGAGRPVLSLSAPVVIESYGFADPFLGTEETPGRAVQVGLRVVGRLRAGT